MCFAVCISGCSATPLPVVEAAQAESDAADVDTTMAEELQAATRSLNAVDKVGELDQQAGCNWAALGGSGCGCSSAGTCQLRLSAMLPQLVSSQAGAASTFVERVPPLTYHVTLPEMGHSSLFTAGEHTLRQYATRGGAFIFLIELMSTARHLDNAVASYLPLSLSKVM